MFTYLYVILIYSIFTLSCRFLSLCGSPLWGECVNGEVQYTHVTFLSGADHRAAARVFLSIVAVISIRTILSSCCPTVRFLSVVKCTPAALESGMSLRALGHDFPPADPLNEPSEYSRVCPPEPRVASSQQKDFERKLLFCWARTQSLRLMLNEEY